MPSMITFFGIGFYVTGAQSQSASVVRVTFSNVPTASNPANSNDALNPDNYILSGPGPAVVERVAAVSGNPMAFDLTLEAPLNIGTWNVNVANVEDVDTSALTPPTSAVFQVSVLFAVPTLSMGAVNDTPDQIIRKHLSPAMQGPNWDALISALSTGDESNWENAQSAFDQLFASTASGAWLEKRANDEGILKPINVGMSDDLFRQYIIKLSTNKVVHQAIREILEVFYGQDAERAFVESAVDEPYNMTSDPDLQWTLDEKQNFTIVFNSDEFNQPSAATALEVATALSELMQQLGSDGFAIPFKSPQAGGNRIRIYSGSLGLGSFARVTGGMAQNIFQFPALLSTYTGTITGATGYNWVYTNPLPNVTRATLTINTASANPLITLTPVSGDENDYVIITTDAGIGVTGTFPVTNIQISYSGSNLIQSFDLPYIGFTGIALQEGNDAYTFYQPIKNSIFAAGSRTVLVAQSDSELNISIPATTQAVNRGPKEAFYGRDPESVSIERAQCLPSGQLHIITDQNHGLSMGSQVQLDGIMPNPNRPWITPGNGATYPSVATNPAAFISLSNQSQLPSNPSVVLGAAVTLPNGQILFAGGETFSSGVGSNELAVCERFQPDGSTLVIDGTEADGASQYSYQWLATASMNHARIQQGISAYEDGALVTGGFVPSTTTTLTSVEFYDPNANTWTNLSSLNTGRYAHSQLLLPNGEVLVVSGSTTNTTELYNGSSWTTLGSLTYQRTNFQLVQLSTGLIMAIGGQSEDSIPYPSLALSSVEVSSNSGSTWTLGGSLALARSQHQATLLPGNYVLVTGGVGFNPTQSNYLNSASLRHAEMYDPNAQRWEVISSPGIRRHGHMAVYLPSRGEVVVFGGYSTQGDDTTIIESFNVSTRKWSIWPSKNSQLMSGAFGGLTDNQIVSMGGSSITSSTPLGAILDSDVYALWRAENNQDAAGHYNLSTSSGGAPSEIAAVINNGWFLDPTVTNQGYYAALTNSDTLSLRRGATTVEAWVYPRTTGSGGAFIIVNGLAFSITPADTLLLQFGLSASSNHIFASQSVNPSTSNTCTSNGSLPVGSWSHVACVRIPTGSPAGSTFTYKLYINGVLDSTFTGVVGLDSGTFSAVGGNTDYVGIGGYVTISGPGTQSTMVPINIDDIRWSNVARSDADIAETYLRGRSLDFQFNSTFANPEILTPASNTVSNGGFNGQFPVASIVSATEFTIDTTGRSTVGYASTYGPSYSGQATSGGFWAISTATRAAGIVTLTLSLPSGINGHNVQVGNVVWVNSEASQFPSGFKTVTATSNTTVTYVEAGLTVGPISVVGSVSQNSAPNALETPVAAVPQPVNDPGPYVYDPLNGLAITETSSTTSGFVLNKDQQYNTVEINGIDQFPDEQGWIVIGFGTPQQTIPIMYLGSYSDTPSTTKLILDYSYVFQANFPIGSNVTLLAQRGAFVPAHPEQVGSAYITASEAGRAAAETAINSAVAAGINVNINVTYPGDRGLGAEGYPDSGSGKLSDIVEIFAGDSE